MPFVNTLRSSTTVSFGKKRGGPGGLPLFGKLFGWGANYNGQLGLNNTTRYDSPIQVGALTNWKTPSGGSTNASVGFTLCTKADGSLWSWGANPRGQLGSGTTVARSSPVQIGSLTDWLQPSAGYRSSICSKTDGTLWAWGSNSSFGGLGLNDLIYRSSPVQIGSLTDWSSRFSNTGLDFCIAVKTDGKLWAWGRNHYGQLGNGLHGSGGYRSSPVQIGSSSNWYIPSNGRSHTACTTTDGKLFVWGDNGQGQLGLGDTVKRSSPVQVGALTNWKQPMGGYAQTICIKTDGTLWAWGNNDTGELGQGDLVARSSPTQIGSLTDWKLLRQGNSNGATTAMGTKTDGSLFAWGAGGVGQTGQGYGSFRSSPIVVGTLKTWITPTQAGTSVLCTQA